jgi:hypothetical protein
MLDSVRYAIWRFALWTRGYGSYEAIDRAVRDGLIVPGTPPDKVMRRGEPRHEEGFDGPCECDTCVSYGEG